MPAGRKPKPVEQKRRTGRAPGRDSGGRKLPEPAQVVSLPGCGDAIPATPRSLVPGGAGEERWRRLWQEAAGWLSPGVDHHILVRLCEAEDMRHGMREALADEGFSVVGSMGQMRPNPLIDKLRALDDQITKYESLCGLTPSDRGRLGVGEVKGGEAKSPLDAILERAANRR